MSLVAVDLQSIVSIKLNIPFFLLDPPRIPIIGHALIGLKLSPEAVVIRSILLHKQHGSVISAHLGPRAFVFLTEPQDIEIILSSPAHINKSVEYR